MKGLDQEISMSALTVGEANLKAGNPRALMWVLAVFMPSACIGMTLGVAYALYTDPHFAVHSLWRLLPVVLCGVHMALVSVIVTYMNLFLPHAPVAVRAAVLEVGWVCISIPLVVITTVVACFGYAWMVVTVAYLLVVVIFGTIAYWVYLAHTYGK